MVQALDIRERLIVALDFDTADAAREMVRCCESRVGFFKVGLELFMVDWFHTIDWLVARGHHVMLDLKYFDIPETVKRAVARVRGHGVRLLTVHAEESVVKAAVAARGDMNILAVTVLTSSSDDDLQRQGMTTTITDLVRRRAAMAIGNGGDGVVCSGREAQVLRQDLGDRFLLVTPGIRAASSTIGPDDQKRTMTPGQAMLAGADHLVVGRPITRAADPVAVIDEMQREIAAALAR